MVEGLIDTRDKEDQSNPRMGQHVGKCIEPIIPRPIWNGDGVVIQDVYEPRFFTAWRCIPKAIGTGA